MKKFFLMLVLAGSSFFTLNAYVDEDAGDGGCGCKDKLCVYNSCKCETSCKNSGSECAGIKDCK
ncbi:hypothetical protein [Haliscomenobacter sp.]|uniref:hypothetical protein n=1 Tax=Haliscomenobacter sp. TaxID=2717303 RepID=UPI003BAC4278